MNNIAICIPTYKRPEMLARLLQSILESSLDFSLIKDVKIYVVDNDINKSAEEVTTIVSNNCSKPFYIHYYHYPIKGLANVRNKLLTLALRENPHFIVFIDDDEYPIREWLNELVSTILNNNADMAMGPVIPEFEDMVPDSMAYWFERPKYNQDTKIHFIATNNLILRAESLLKYKIRFDSRFNFSGAEDSYFGVQMRKKSAFAVWASEALVYEYIPKNRTRLLWLIERNYRSAANYVFILRIEKEYFKVFRKAVISFGYIIIGFIALFLIVFPVKRRYWGIIKVSEGVGGFSGIINVRPVGY